MHYPSEVFVVEMSYDSKGRGPETDPKKISETHYQIWTTDTFQLVAEYPTKEEAVYQAELLNESLSGM